MTEQHDVSPADETNMSTESAAVEEATEEVQELKAEAPGNPDPEAVSVDDSTEPPAADEAAETIAAEDDAGDASAPGVEEQAEAAADIESLPDPEPSQEPAAEEKTANAVEEPAPVADKAVASKTLKAPAPVVPPTPRPERPEVAALRAAQEKQETVDGKIIGWNNGGLHVVVNGITGFCPRSEIELGAPQGPENYLDKTLPFLVLRVQKRGRRIVLSRRALLQGDRDGKVETLRAAMRAGEVLEGTVSSVTDFGAFVDVGGIDGLIHVSEISRSRIEHAGEVLSKGDTVKVRVLKISEDGSRVSLSAKALEPDPWDGIEERFPAGEMVTGRVERTADFGAFIEIAPGLTGLLPTSAMNLPRDASPARIYQPGKEVSVQIFSIDRRRQRISLALEGSQAEGTKADLKSFRDQQSSTQSSFGALAAAFEKARKND